MTDTKIALITGGSRGLGRATALAIAAQGVDSIITYRSNSDAAKAVVAEVEGLGRKAVALELDTSVVAGFAEFVGQVRAHLRQDWGRDDFDILVNNAGIGGMAPFAELTEELFDRLFAVHVKGVFFLTQQLLPVIRDGGTIVNFSSGLTRFTAPGQSAYASAKGAVEVLTRYQAAELGSRGIRVNTIAPGATASEFGGGYLQSDEVRSAIGARVALGRMGEPEDIGNAVAALVSDSGRWINAQRVEASGGQSI
jgi:NAD(P)-dependent dehydrogenase (short-subunit alcohol dehydrogenase family)